MIYIQTMTRKTIIISNYKGYVIHCVILNNGMSVKDKQQQKIKEVISI